VQTAYHYRSLALYTKLGVVTREPLSVLQGSAPAVSVPGRGVRPARDGDLPAGNALCMRVHGHDRDRELRDAMRAGTARVVERPERVTGYATGFGYGWHAIAETNEDLIALLASAEAFIGLGVLLPSRNAGLLRWCLEHGVRLVQQNTLMTTGLYNEPAGVYLPSIRADRPRLSRRGRGRVCGLVEKLFGRVHVFQALSDGRDGPLELVLVAGLLLPPPALPPLPLLPEAGSLGCVAIDDWLVVRGEPLI
jgi:hypothetical protein